jgi:hypothetical protein
VTFDSSSDATWPFLPMKLHRPLCGGVAAAAYVTRFVRSEFHADAGTANSIKCVGQETDEPSEARVMSEVDVTATCCELTMI